MPTNRANDRGRPNGSPRGGWRSLVLTLAWAAAGTALGQSEASNWRKFRIADGLPEVACVSVTASPRGEVLVTHLNSPLITRLTGYGIETMQAPDSGLPRKRVYESSGGQYWTVAPNGLLERRPGGWSLFTNLAEVASLVRSNLARPSDPVPLYPVRQGYVLCLFPDHLAGFECDDPTQARLRMVRDASRGRIGRFSSMGTGRDGGLWLAGEFGLAKAPGPIRTLKAESDWRDFLPPPDLQLRNFQDPHEDRNGDVTMLAECGAAHQRVVAHFDGWSWSTNAAGADRVRLAWRGFDGSIFTLATNALFQSDENGVEMQENEEVSARYYYDLAVEPNGTFWLATSDGLLRYSPPAWRTPRRLNRLSTSVSCLTADAEDRLWFISAGVLHSVREDSHEEFALPLRPGRRLLAVRKLLPLRNHSLLLDAAGQCLLFQPGGGGFTNAPGLTNRAERFRALGALKDGRVCVQRLSSVPGVPASLQLFDGEHFEALPQGAPAGCGAELETLFAAQNGDLWLSGDKAVAVWHAGKWRVFTSTDRSTPGSAAVAFAEAPDGRIWCATGDTLWEFDGRNWTALRSGFDQVSSFLRSRDGTLWVGANNGLHRLVGGAWLENGREEGLGSDSIRGLLEDQAGRLWAGTAHGLSAYDPSVDRDPPETHIRIHEFTSTGSRLPEGGTITLRFAGMDKWNYTPAPRLLYSYQLDDHEWSPFSEKDGVSFSDQPPGVHIVRARAMDRCGNLELKPTTFEFEVVLPWYRETRLVGISAAGLAGALFFAALAFNRHLRLVRSYAEVERMVAERTRELELANRELLHSQKMTALGTLAAGIAHDFNNILSIIQGSAQIIEENLENQSKVLTRVQRIKTVVEQGSATVKAMLGFSRDSGPQPEPCQVNQVVEDTVKLLGDRFLREVQVDLDLGRDLPPVLASKDLVQQILLNFLFNAAEAMTGRRLVTLISRKLEKLPDTLVLAPARAADYVAVSVRDSGGGIPPENLGRIFEPFFTTKALSARRGTGLGLSMVYEFAKKIGAGLAVRSILNKGSTFTLILPVAAPDPPPSS